jgi:hypothetical protein
MDALSREVQPGSRVRRRREAGEGSPMGFTIYYRSTRRLSRARASAIREAAATLSEGRTWLSCEPVHFFADLEDGRLLGGVKPNFQPHPDDVAAAAREALPDGTVRDLIEVLCELSRCQGVDWEFRHDHDPGPIGFIRAGVGDARLLEQVEALADWGGILGALTEESGGPFGGLPPSAPGTPGHGPDTEDEDDADGGPWVLPFRPRGS